ncbi:pyridoxal phosphate-dependent aminotransferase [Halobaculum sp. MBLA0147]|uniref:pyridoxal phosphate-dependent aminotransferase n=1 Tax=Halobaculum sp. MBLA0147 TaxID=3079934 RepID=UPI003524A33A
MFPTLDYLTWIRGRPAAATHDLGSSDLDPTEPSATPDPVPERLRGLADPDHDRPLAAQIAAEYGVDPTQVLPTAGATHANFLVAAAALSARGADASTAAHDTTGPPRETTEPAHDTATAAVPRVLVESPGYEPLVATPDTLGGRVERFERSDGRLDADRLAAAVEGGVTAGTADPSTSPLALVTVSNRHNPTGRLASRSELADVAAVTAASDGLCHVDEVYAPYGAAATGDSDETARDDDRTAFGGPTAAGLPNTVVTGSLTKFHGFGGVRLGWVVGPDRWIERVERVRHYVPGVAEPSVALARRFFAHRDELVAAGRDHCRRNAALLADFVADRSDVTTTAPPGCPFGLLTHDRADGDTVAEAAWDAGILVVPGRFFGCPESVRVSLGRAPEHCEPALAALGDVLDDL